MYCMLIVFCITEHFKCCLLPIIWWFVSGCRMIETHEPERAIELYKKACDVCEVKDSLTCFAVWLCMYICIGDCHVCMYV